MFLKYETMIIEHLLSYYICSSKVNGLNFGTSVAFFWNTTIIFPQREINKNIMLYWRLHWSWTWIELLIYKLVVLCLTEVQNALVESNSIRNVKRLCHVGGWQFMQTIWSRMETSQSVDILRAKYIDIKYIRTKIPSLQIYINSIWTLLQTRVESKSEAAVKRWKLGL